MATIEHLNGREKALEPFGWPARQAEWIALACLHGDGLFTREQAAFHLRMSRWQALRFVQALVRKGVAAEDIVENRKVCRILNRPIFQALDAGDIRRRTVASRDGVYRRLLSLDYVIQNPGLPWLPTEEEKVRAFETLGIGRKQLPVRVHRGAVGEARHYFRLKLPIALDGARAVFVYADPGHGTGKALASWGAAHRGLWKVLKETNRRVEVVAVAAEDQALSRAERVLGRWAATSVRTVGDPAAVREIARIEKAILAGDVRVIEEYGSLQAALQRSVALKRQGREHSNNPMVDGFATWWSTRTLGTAY